MTATINCPNQDGEWMRKHCFPIDGESQTLRGGNKKKTGIL